MVYLDVRFVMEDVKFANEVELAEKIAIEVHKENGCTYYVGGYVRDSILGRENKDIDIEVHRISPDKLMEILKKFGEPVLKGVSFGVYGIKGYDIDISMPRSEVANGRGHRDFEVFVDPNLGEYKACVRRDFTINAMMRNVLSGNLIDYFGGKEDLENGIIRHVNRDTFIEDPLRVLRACQFAARFGFEVAEETVELCKTMDLKELSAERIYGELVKALLKSRMPSIFFDELYNMGHLNYWFKEVRDLKGVWQNQEHHPEGDVYTHTMMVLDEAAKLLKDEAFGDSVFGKIEFMLSALCHDFGKPYVTNYDPVKQKITAYSHDVEGVVPAMTFLKRMRASNGEIKYVTNMVENHMYLNRMVKETNKQSKYNHAFDKSIDPYELILLSMCDACGRGKKVDYSEDYHKLMTKLNNYEMMIKNVEEVNGKDLMAIGVPKGPVMGQLLKRGHYLMLSGVRKDIIIKELAKEFRSIVNNK